LPELGGAHWTEHELNDLNDAFFCKPGDCARFCDKSGRFFQQRGSFSV
jgi:hypothetical protein